MAYRDIALLNRHYALNNALRFEINTAGQPIAIIETEQATARISLFGGQVLQWTPKPSSPALWLSELADLSGRKAIRGGIPICWPWFGAHPSKPESASHGFARLMNWQIAGSSINNDNIVLELDLPCSPDTLKRWPHRFRLTLAIEIGRTLSLHLCTTNLDNTPFRYSEALHTYFKTSNIHNLEISGLEDTRYIDALDNNQIKTHATPIRFHKQTDRIYLNTKAEAVIHSPRRRIHIKKQGSLSSVVWNPWVEKTTNMADFPNDDWRHMVCVETANVAENSVNLAPGESHTLSLSLHVTP